MGKHALPPPSGVRTEVLCRDEKERLSRSTGKSG